MRTLTRRRFLARTAALAAAAPLAHGLSRQVFAAGADAPRKVNDPRTPLARGELVAGLYDDEVLGPKIALTFDDMPRKNYTRVVLDMLKRKKMRATFFVEGDLVRVLPDYVKRIVDEGHTLGNHSYTHHSFGELTLEQIGDELDRTQDAVDAALGRHHPLRLVRPPFGAPWIGVWKRQDRIRTATALKERGAFLILWQMASRDTFPGCTRDRVFKEVRDQLDKRRGGALVFHPMNCSRHAMWQILYELQHKSAGMTTVEALLEAKYGVTVDKLAERPTALGRKPKIAAR